MKSSKDNSKIKNNNGRFFFKNIFLKPTPKTIIGAILLALFIFAIRSAVLIPSYNYIIELFSLKPKVIINVLKMEYAPIGDKPLNVNKSFLAYYNQETNGTLFIFDTSVADTLNSKAIFIHGLNFNFIACPECTYYWITATNLNYENIDKIVLDIKSDYLPEITTLSTKITTAKCGGIFNNKGCYVVIENLAKEEQSTFTLVIPIKSNITVASSKINNKYSCEIRYLHGLAKTFVNNEKGIMFGSKMLYFPNHWNGPINTMYMFDPNKNIELVNPWNAIVGGKSDAIKK